MERSEWRQLSAAEERTLAARARRGDLAARDRLLESQLAWIAKRCHAYARLEGLDFDDLFSDSVALFLDDTLPRFDPDRGRLTTLVHLAVRRVAKNLRQKRQRTLPTVRLVTTPEIPVADYPGRLAAAEAETAALRSISTAIAQLPDREAEILHLRAAGESLERIGRSLGVSKERVRQIETRALEQVRRTLGIA